MRYPMDPFRPAVGRGRTQRGKRGLASRHAVRDGNMPTACAISRGRDHATRRKDSR
jgi:hypothetical protein